MSLVTPLPVSNDTLTAHVEDLKGLTIDIVTLTCAGDCVDVVAVAHGGNPPYAFEWDDGSGSAARHVCLATSQQLTVTVTDTPLPAQEFGHAAQRAQASVSANVSQCPDAGTPPPRLCILNPSLEGTPGFGEFGLMLPNWTVCDVTPDVGPVGFASGSASVGSTYLGIGTYGSGGLTEEAGTMLCAELKPSASVSFSVDLTLDSFLPGPGTLQIWGGSNSCSKDELLWTSPTIAQHNVWKTVCGTLTPTKPLSYLVLRTEAESGAYIDVDNFKPKARCE